MRLKFSLIVALATFASLCVGQSHERTAVAKGQPAQLSISANGAAGYQIYMECPPGWAVPPAPKEIFTQGESAASWWPQVHRLLIWATHAQCISRPATLHRMSDGDLVILVSYRDSQPFLDMNGTDTLHRKQEEQPCQVVTGYTAEGNLRCARPAEAQK